MMRILHVLAGVDPRGGGPHHAIRCIVREQVRLGHQVAVLATSVQSAQPLEPEESFVDRMLSDPSFAGAEVYLGSTSGGPYGRHSLWSRYCYSPACARWLRRRLADLRRRPQVVNIHGVFSHLTSAAAAQARRLAIPYVIQPMGALNRACLRMEHRLLKGAFLRAFLQKDLRKASWIHAASDSEAEELSRWVRLRQIRTVPLGVDIPDFDAGESAERFLARFPQLRGKRVVLFMSRITAKKRPELLVKALARLRAADRRMVLVVAGSADEHGEIVQSAVRRHALEESVVFAGYLQGELKQGAFAAAEVFALPSLDENFGIAVVEAMAHGVAVLTTPGVASHVYVDRSGGGMTVPDSAEAVADGIRTILRNDPRVMGQRGRRFVEWNLSWPSTVRQLDAAYRETLGR